MHDLPSPSSRPYGLPLRVEPQQIHWIELQRGALLVALEGGIRLSYRVAALASIGLVAPLLTLHIDEGECHRVEDRGWYGVSGVARSHASVLILPAAGIARMTRLRQWLVRTRAHAKAWVFPRGRST